jgi:hypothetical protein
LPEDAGIGATPAIRANCASVAKRSGAGGLADQDRRGDRAAADLGEQLGTVGGDERVQFALEEGCLA